MATYLAGLGIPADSVSVSERPSRGILVYTLATPPSDASTIDLASRPELGIQAEQVSLHVAPGRVSTLHTVSRKEIALSLMQHGRLTELKGDACSVEVLSRHIALRQRIVAWAERLRWGWPDGGPAVWNEAYWRKGTPRTDVSLVDAMGDLFANQAAYKIGCYTAAKLVFVQGVLDYFVTAQPLPGLAEWVHSRLLSDGEPLLDVEPGIAWRFEADFDPRDAAKPGKVASIVHRVGPKNFVPGDWAYLLNPDSRSRRKVGYEGSSTIYLGGGRFSDYYGENNHAFSYAEKLEGVYQWRHGVFDPVRDADKRKPLGPGALERLGRTPARGGLVMDWRITPALFASQIRQRLAAPDGDLPDGSAGTPVPLVDLGTKPAGNTAID